ncbi:pyridoxal phosphate-dependent transferase [Boeremia exigua]|uniref:pyridoxal phosphate-dependent transferase n=1 Tax=Boeremia exigua TaxID=749465 RepID=UPI001E8CC18B|nr:pyridoxal phosphate-dependent transferase [Boeremia exigua]KAH6616860.1 pyridoxal phosphate-dependent transferase [Boeremia exigua]
MNPKSRHAIRTPTQLCVFRKPVTVSETFMRTARYAENPKKYLEKTSDSLVSSRQGALSSPLLENSMVDMDLYGSGTCKDRFEKTIAHKLGKSHGLFFLTGTQAQLSALKTHATQQQRSLIGWHPTSHLETSEQESYKYLYNLNRVLVGTNRNRLASMEEINDIVSRPVDQRPAAILLEIPNRTLGCATYSFSELEKISSMCRTAGVALHCDGARIWEIEAFYNATSGKSFDDIGALFDSVYVSLYKGLGGITGAMVLHNDKAFIEELKIWQHRAGGRPFTLAYEIADCERGYHEMVNTFSRKREKMIRVVREISRATATQHNSHGERIVRFVPEVPTCCQVLTYFDGFNEHELLAARDRVEQQLNVRIFERLRSSFDIIDTDSEATKTRLLQHQLDLPKQAAVPIGKEYIEWRIGSVTEQIADDVFVETYVAFCNALKGLVKCRPGDSTIDSL